MSHLRVFQHLIAVTQFAGAPDEYLVTRFLLKREEILIDPYRPHLSVRKSSPARDLRINGTHYQRRSPERDYRALNCSEKLVAASLVSGDCRRIGGADDEGDRPYSTVLRDRPVEIGRCASTGRLNRSTAMLQRRERIGHVGSGLHGESPEVPRGEDAVVSATRETTDRAHARERGRRRLPSRPATSGMPWTSKIGHASGASVPASPRTEAATESVAGGLAALRARRRKKKSADRTRARTEAKATRLFARGAMSDPIGLFPSDASASARAASMSRKRFTGDFARARRRTASSRGDTSMSSEDRVRGSRRHLCRASARPRCAPRFRIGSNANPPPTRTDRLAARFLC